MKTPSTETVSVTHQIPRLAPAAATGIKTLQLMKTKLTILLIILSGAFATTTVFGAIHTWTGTGTELGAATNWGGTLPNAANDDTGLFNGTPAGDLSLVYSLNTLNTYGVEFNLATSSSQTGSVTISPPASANSSNIRFNCFTNASGAGVFNWGNNSAGPTKLFVITLGTTGGQTHTWENDSANKVTIKSNVSYVLGGGGTHTLLLTGTGDWAVTNSLRANNGSTIIPNKGGSGTMTWTAGGTYNSALGGPFTISGGTVILESSGLLGSQNIVNNGTLLQYDASSGSATFSGIISGTGPLNVSAGLLTLSGANTYTANTVLSGGELIVGSAENAGVSGPLGNGGTISFTGGTLGFSANNIFDYSPRFSTDAGQMYKFDTAGQYVTLATGLSSSGGTLTKVGPGSLVLGGTSSYSGLTTVSAGRLAFQGSKTGTANITVNDGAALTITDTGTPVTPNTLAVGTSYGAVLEFNNVNSTASAPLAPVTLSSAGTVGFNINGGTFTVGQHYPLLSWGSGSAPAVSLGTVVGAVGALSTNGTAIQFTPSILALIWNGNVDGNWGSANNWLLAGSPATYSDPSNVAFDDTATGTTNVTVNALVQPASVTIYNNKLTYTITSSSGLDIGGAGSLIKGGSGTLTLSGGANTYTGVTTVSGGTLSVGSLANGGSASDIGAASSSAGNLVFNGGTLQYTGSGATIDRLFTLGTFGGTINVLGSALALTNSGAIAMSGVGARLLTLSGTNTDNNTLGGSLSDNGGATALAKISTGKWVLTGNNAQSGVTTIANGLLQVGAGGASGALGTGNIIDNASLDFNRTGTLTVGTISGTGSVTNEGSGTVILPGDNTYTGGTTIKAGTLQVGNGGATGSLDSGSPIVNNNMLIFNTTGSSVYLGGGLISGTGNVIVRGSGGLVKAIGANSYTGWTQIDPGATFQPCEGNTGGFVSPFVTNNGTLKFVRQDVGVFTYPGTIVGTGSVVKDVNNFVAGDVTLTGTNTYTGGTYVLGGTLILGDNSTAGAGLIVGNVFLTNSVAFGPVAMLEFNHPEDLTFSGNIVGNGTLLQQGSGVLTLTGASSQTNTTIDSTLQIGNGGTSGSISGNINDVSVLIFNRSDDVTYGDNGSVISGSGTLVKQGSGTLTLAGTNTYTGPTIVSNGTLVVSGSLLLNGEMDVMGGTLAAGPVGSVSTLTLGGSLNIQAGAILVSLNKALSPSNSVYSAGGVNYLGGGSLKLLNVGPALTVGDTFTFFGGQAVSGGAAMTIVSPGFTVANHLDTDGSVTVTGVASSPEKITATVSGGNLNLSWPVDYTGLHLQVQTNSLTTGLGTNWVTIPGTDAGHSYSAALNYSNGCLFYRLAP